jgi:hypothetical protein
MANNKTGLSYYNIDTDRYLDEKIKRLRKNFGCTGLAVYDYILCEIYRDKGCFLVWGENTAFDVADYLGLKETSVMEIVHYCANVGLFDKELLRCGNGKNSTLLSDCGSNELLRIGSVLSSRSIQQRYYDICCKSKRKKINIPTEIMLISIQNSGSLPQNSGILPQNSGSLPQNSGSLPQSKVKKSKVKNPPNPLKGDDSDFEFTFDKFWDLYDKKVGKIDSLRKKWAKLSKQDKVLIFEYLPKYKQANPDKKYRKNPETFLNNQSWNDEIINNGKEQETTGKQVHDFTEY